MADQIQKYLHNYGDLDRACLRWTDQCRNCSRSIGREITSSNIGIACQPVEVECLESSQDAGKK